MGYWFPLGRGVGYWLPLMKSSSQDQLAFSTDPPLFSSDFSSDFSSVVLSKEWPCGLLCGGVAPTGSLCGVLPAEK